MENSVFQKMRDAISRNETIAVVVGKNPSIDEMGAALALYLTLQNLGKKVTVASPTEPIVEISSLVGIDKVVNRLDGGGADLVVSFPYREGEIDKVSYTIDNGYLNIVVKAGENGLSFSETEVKYTRGGAFPTLLFVVGTARLSDLGNLFDPQALKDTTVVNIDNKSDNQGFGDIAHVSLQFSSVSEAVADFLFDLEPHMDIDVAQNLLSGISYATDNFQKPATSFIAFEIAAQLMRIGAKRTLAARDSRVAEPSRQQDKSYFPPVGQSFPQSPPVLQKQQHLGQMSQRDNTQKDMQRSASGASQRQTDQRSQTDQRDTRSKNPPSDWLVPKVYKGSTNI